MIATALAKLVAQQEADMEGAANPEVVTEVTTATAALAALEVDMEEVASPEAAYRATIATVALAPLVVSILVQALFG